MRLFESKPDLQSIWLRGPFVLATSKQALLSGKILRCTDARNFRISCADAARLVLRDENNRKTLLKSAHFYIEALGRSVDLQAGDSNDNNESGATGSHNEQRSYKGSLFLSCHQGKLVIENELPTKEYISCVVASEALPGAQLEALKAQSILCQTILYWHIKSQSSHNTAAGQGASGYSGSLGDSTRSQVYKGLTPVTGPVYEAVRQTFGQVLSYKQRPAQVFYHSTCAGGTSPINVLLPRQESSKFPYLQGIQCNYCRDSNFYHPTDFIVGASESSLRKDLFPCEIVKSDKQGRPLKIKTADGIVFGFNYWLKLGQNYGWGKVPGMRFTVTGLKSGDFKITSTGAGHGVGLCQWGSSQQAKEGKSYKEILEYYFPGTSLLLL